MKCFDPNHSSVEPGIRLQEFPERLSGDIPAARECNMRMPRTKFRLETSSERGFLHSLVNLKQVRVRLADADPDNFRHAVCREHSDANNGQKEGAEFNYAEFFSQREIDFIRNIAVETERQMHLRGIGPAHTANVRINGCKQLAC